MKKLIGVFICLFAFSISTYANADTNSSCEAITGKVNQNTVDAGLVYSKSVFGFTYYYTTGDDKQVYSWFDVTIYKGSDGKGYLEDPMSCGSDDEQNDDDQTVECEVVVGKVDQAMIDAGLIYTQSTFGLSYYYTTGDNQRVWSWSTVTIYVGADGKGYLADPKSCSNDEEQCEDLNNNGICDVDEEESCEDLNDNGICDVDEEEQCEDLNDNGICDVDEEEQCEDLNNNDICDVDEEEQCEDLNDNGVCDEDEEQEENTAKLFVNEIVAKPVDGNDWIEFYVAGEGSVNLSDYAVVDDDDEHELQTLPNVTLKAGEFFVVEAIGDAEDATTENYVLFKLGKADSVILSKDGETIQTLTWEDGQADEGYSYGLFADGSESAMTLEPTKGSANKTTEIIETAVFVNEIMAKDADGGNDWIELYVAEGEVNLSDYTVKDDNDETVAQALPNVTLKAGSFFVVEAVGDAEDATTANYVLFKLGKDDKVILSTEGKEVHKLSWDDGEAPEGYTYGLLVDGVEEDEGTLNPTPGAANEVAGEIEEEVELDFFKDETIQEIYIEIDQADWQAILASPLDEEYYPANVTYQGETVTNVAFRTKGNSSLDSVARDSTSDRYSFKIDFNEYVEGQKFAGMKKINLNNNFSDPTYMRETLAYDIFRNYGVPVPRTKYVNLYINGALHGFYTLVEQIDSEFIERHFANDEGDLYKPDMAGMNDNAGADLVWVNNSIDSYPGVRDGLKTNEETSDHSAIINLINEINNGSDYDSVIDVDMFLRYLAISTAIVHLDNYPGQFTHNYYLYEQNGKFTLIPWDLNMAWGSFSMGCDANGVDLYIDEPTMESMSDRPLVDKILAVPAYKATYHKYLQEIISDLTDASVLNPKIDATADKIRSYVESDPTAFYTITEFEDGIYGDFTTNSGGGFGGGMGGQPDQTGPALIDFNETRVESVQDQLDGSKASSGTGSGSCSSGFGWF